MAKFIIGGIIGATIFGILLLICYLFCGKKDGLNFQQAAENIDNIKDIYEMAPKNDSRSTLKWIWFNHLNINTILILFYFSGAKGNAESLILDRFIFTIVVFIFFTEGIIEMTSICFRICRKIEY